MKKALGVMIMAFGFAGCGSGSGAGGAGDAAAHNAAQVPGGVHAPLIQCDVAAIAGYGDRHMNIRWDVLGAAFLQTDLAVPSDADSAVANFGGAAPPYDSMLFCTTSHIAQLGDHIQVSLTIKRVSQPTSAWCSGVNDATVLSTETETFPLGRYAGIRYRYYNGDGSSEARMRILYYGRPGEFAGTSPEAARARCEQLIHDRDGDDDGDGDDHHHHGPRP